MSSENILKGLQPEAVWRYFSEICRIPHGSKNEAAIIQYVSSVAKTLGLQAATDTTGNVIVRKPATPGKESLPGVALQCHLDMVCEKNNDTVHDFLKDPIILVRDGNILKAQGTTLGADNGIGVAMALALMEASDLQHGPLEMLFTVDEETGLTGASHLAKDMLSSRIMINLDSEEDWVICVGCAPWRLGIEPRAQW